MSGITFAVKKPIQPKRAASPPQNPPAVAPTLPKWSIGIVIALHFLLCLLFNWAVPFGNNGYANTPDEGAHFQFVQHIAENWSLPTFEGYEGAGYESHQPPLYYFLAAIWHKATASLPEPGKWLRLLSSLFSAGVVWLIWRAVRSLIPGSPYVALGASGFAAFLPMHIAIGSAVGNDSLTNLMFAGALGSLLTLYRAPSTKNALLSGGWLGAALLTKATAILLLPLALMAVFGLVRFRSEPVKMAQAIRIGLSMMMVALLLGGGWFVRNAILYDDPLMQKTFTQAFGGTAKASDFLEGGMTWGSYLSLVAQWTFRSFWFAFGSPETAQTGVPLFMPDALYLMALLWQIAALIGLAIRLREPVDTPNRFSAWLLASAFALTSVTFLLFIRIFFQAQGRYFFPALLPIAFFNALGWEGLFPKAWRERAHLTLMIALCLLSVLIWAAVLRE